MTSILTNEKYKGDALLQKTFTVDFLNKVIKKNEGEVKQYYVEDNHAPIISPEEYDAVQAEMERRKACGRSYSGNSIFSSKLICADCGGSYGAKVWHSTDAYRRVIWRCNQKYEKKCGTPTISEETIKSMFLKAYNGMMGDRAQVIEDCETMRHALNDCTEIDSRIGELWDEITVVSQMVKNQVRENALAVQSQEEYGEKREALVKRYETAREEYEQLTAERRRRTAQQKAIRRFIDDLKGQPLVLRVWDEQVWTLLVESATVHADGSMDFHFKCGNVVSI